MGLHRKDTDMALPATPQISKFYPCVVLLGNHPSLTREGLEFLEKVPENVNCMQNQNKSPRQGKKNWTHVMSAQLESPPTFPVWYPLMSGRVYGQGWTATVLRGHRQDLQRLQLTPYYLKTAEEWLSLPAEKRDLPCSQHGLFKADPGLLLRINAAHGRGSAACSHHQITSTSRLLVPP